MFKDLQTRRARLARPSRARFILPVAKDVALAALMLAGAWAFSVLYYAATTPLAN